MTTTKPSDICHVLAVYNTLSWFMQKHADLSIIEYPRSTQVTIFVFVPIRCSSVVLLSLAQIVCWCRMQRRGTAGCPLAFESNSRNRVFHLIIFGIQSIVTVSVLRLWVSSSDNIHTYVLFILKLLSLNSYPSLSVKNNTIYTLPLSGVNHWTIESVSANPSVLSGTFNENIMQ